MVLGDDPSHVFSIKIDSNKDVSMLRKAIEDDKKSAFDSINADRLPKMSTPFVLQLSTKLRFRSLDLMTNIRPVNPA
jgi:hypothetical protein